MRRVMTKAVPCNNPWSQRNRAPQGVGPAMVQREMIKRASTKAVNVRMIIPDTAPMVLKDMTTKTIVPEPTVRAPNSRAGIKEPLNKTRVCEPRRDDGFADEPGERRGSEWPFPSQSA
jgi:hypothetical protein